MPMLIPFIWYVILCLDGIFCGWLTIQDVWFEMCQIEISFFCLLVTGFEKKKLRW